MTESKVNWMLITAILFLSVVLFAAVKYKECPECQENLDQSQPETWSEWEKGEKGENTKEFKVVPKEAPQEANPAPNKPKPRKPGSG